MFRSLFYKALEASMTLFKDKIVYINRKMKKIKKVVDKKTLSLYNNKSRQQVTKDDRKRNGSLKIEQCKEKRQP